MTSAWQRVDCITCNCQKLQTGEGKTLAAVPAVYALALACGGVHGLTANDDLAKRDPGWMGEINRSLGLSVSYVSQGM